MMASAMDRSATAGSMESPAAISGGVLAALLATNCDSYYMKTNANPDRVAASLLWGCAPACPSSVRACGSLAVGAILLSGRGCSVAFRGC